MKILFVAHSFPRFDGDVAGAFLISLCTGLIRRGHEVMAVVPHDEGLAPEEEIRGVTVRRFRYGAEGRETLAYKGTMADQVLRSWGARWQLIRFLAAYRSEVIHAVREWHPDAIHVHWWFPGGVALQGARLGGTPVVLTSHGTDLFLLDRMRIARGLGRRVFRAARRVTVISTPLVERVAALGVARDKVAVIPMPVDTSLVDELQSNKLGPRPDGRIALLFAGRLVERKGAEYAIRALKILVDKGLNASLTIAGDGPLRVDLDNLCDELELGTRVRFAGMLPPDKVLAAMRKSDVFLMPAVTDWKGEQEGFGMVIVEAMLCGVPVVASRSGGITDIIVDGENGLLVSERDSAAIAAAVERVAGDPEFSTRLAAAARAGALERFHPDAIARRFEDVYLSAQ